MREIKFRALKDDISNCNFYYGSLIYDKQGNPRIYDVDTDLFHTCIKDTEGQLWKPSEGLEFYSGDLFLAECSPSGSNKKKERICKVDFGSRGMSISIWYKKEWWAYSSMNFTTAKVIGNIHQTPELLNAK